MKRLKSYTMGTIALDGKFWIFRHKYTLRGMEVGTTGFFLFSSCILSREHFCIPLHAPLFLSRTEAEEYYPGTCSLISVYRIDKGLTEQSFYFHVDQQFFYSTLSTVSQTKKYLRNRNWIVIMNPEIVIEDENARRSRTYPKTKSLIVVPQPIEEDDQTKIAAYTEDLKKAKTHLNRYVAKEKYEQAAKERDKIAKITHELQELKKGSQQ